MGLRIIYGKAGSGKSEFCFQEINKIINNQGKIFMITPEQFSYTAEQKLLETTAKSAVLNAEILTFNRMAHRVINEVGGRTKTQLNSPGKAMLIYSILLNNKENLKFLGRSTDNVELLDRTITELKKHSITLQDIEKAINETENQYLKIKLNDIYKIYGEYNKKLENQYLDENDTLDVLIEELELTNMFDNSIIYIDEFIGFTEQEYKIIKYLLKRAKQVNVVMCTDVIKIELPPDVDIFYPSKLTLNKIIDISSQLDINIELAHECKETFRFKSEELKYLEQSLYNMTAKPYGEKNKDIKLFLASNPYSEIEHIAEDILKKVKDKGYRYREISIITKEIDTYSSLIKAIFSKYEIPVFIDDKKDLNQNILIQYILSLLQIFKTNWSYEAMFNYLKLDLNDIFDLSLFKLENYCLKYGIKGSKWYKEDWKLGNEEELKELNKLRCDIVQPLQSFKEKLAGTRTVENISKTLYEFMIENKINEKLQRKIDERLKENDIETANEYKMSWDIITSLLDEITEIFNKEKISFEKYMEIFKVGLQNNKLSKIPQTSDEVIVGDVERSRSRKTKLIYIIGVNDGTFPSINNNEGFLNDIDRQELKQQGIELAKGTIDLLYEENFNIYKAFTTAEEELHLSYTSTTTEGKAIRPSIIIAKIKKIYPDLKEETDIISKELSITNKKATFDNLIVALREHLEGKEISSKWFEVYEYYANNIEWKDKLETAIKGMRYTNVPMNLQEDTIIKLYGDTINSSVSKIEKYQTCAFSFFLKYNLNLKDKRKIGLETVDTGSFMHDIIDEFFEIINSNNLEIEKLNETDINSLVDKIIEDKLLQPNNYIFSSSAKYKTLVVKLSRVIKKAMKYIVNSIVCSNFKVVGHEIEFTNKPIENKKKYDSIKIELEDGKKLEITGKIDRVDVANINNKKYVRIIDYKSSIKDIDLDEMYAGIQIQLLTYLNAINKEENTLSAGVLYFNLIDPIIKNSINLSSEQIEDEIKKSFKMHGLILADVNVVKSMDTTLSKGYSKIIPAYISQEGALSIQRSRVATNEDFSNMQNHIENLLKQISKEILKGNINIKPYYKNKKTACQYCPYMSICNFNTSLKENEYKYI